MAVTTLAPWFGSDRLIVDHIGDALKGCEWVGIPFTGGASAVLAIKARTIACNDLHRHIINLCWHVSKDAEWIASELRDTPFHPDSLKYSQEFCQRMEAVEEMPDEQTAADWAYHYFICVWMGRSGNAGTPAEFRGRPAIRWNAGGGDSNVRFRAAIEALETFHRAMVDRCTFETLDAFDFLSKCHDKPGHGIYADPPFLDAGLKYTHGPSKGEQAEWHWTLARRLRQFEHARVVVRAYDVPLVRELYDGWEFRELTGRKQTNDAAPELLIVLN